MALASQYAEIYVDRFARRFIADRRGFVRSFLKASGRVRKLVGKNVFDSDPWGWYYGTLVGVWSLSANGIENVPTVWTPEIGEYYHSLGSADYPAYLNTLYWYVIRQYHVYKAGCKCQNINCTNSGKLRLEVHHIRYVSQVGDETHKIIGHEHKNPDVLRVLCDVCHEAEHECQRLYLLRHGAKYSKSFLKTESESEERDIGTEVGSKGMLTVGEVLQQKMQDNKRKNA